MSEPQNTTPVTVEVTLLTPDKLAEASMALQFINTSLNRQKVIKMKMDELQSEYDSLGTQIKEKAGMLESYSIPMTNILKA